MHRQSVSLVAVFSALSLSVSALPAGAAAPAPPRGLEGRDTTARSTGEIVVKYRSASRAAEVRQNAQAKLVKRLPQARVEVVEPQGSVAETIAALETDPNVVYAEPNYLYRSSAIVPNDPRYPSLWALPKIGMPSAWTVTKGGPDVTVAVVDSGIGLAHPDLAPNIWTNQGETGGGKDSNGVDDDGNGYVDDWRGWDWIGRDNKPSDAHGHGTHVAGTIGARGNDGYGIAGVNWSTKLVALRGLDSSGVGTSADIAAAFRYAGDMGIDVVNASFGGTGHSSAILEAITSAPETLFVVAAGNEGANNDLAPQYPCNYTAANLICVAASDQNDNLAGFSNYGATSVDLTAPGVGILSTGPAMSTAFADSFESDLTGRWMTGGANNLWARSVDASGGYLTDSPGIDYLNDTDSWAATANPFSLSGLSGCKLTYSLRLSTERTNDVLLVEASRDATAWSKVAGWSGSSNGQWQRLSDDLSSFDGASGVHLRFRLRSNPTITAAGADLDDVRVRCQSDSYTGNEFFTASGTSMAAPHVAGVAGLLKAAMPTATVSQIVSALVLGAKPVVGLAGKVASSGRLDAVRALERLTGSQISEEEPQPQPTASPSPQPSSSPSPQPSTSPAPQPTASPTPQPLPTEDPTGTVTTEHARAITLKLRGALRATGRVTVDGGHEACISEVTVVIKRNGTRIRKITTDWAGYFDVKIRNRRGRYIARALTLQTSEVPARTCLAARSQVRRNG